MPEYLATVRRADGRKATENVEADSADEAVQVLRDRGCAEVVLHSDDIMALFTRQREKANQITPGDYLRLRNHPRLGLPLVLILRGYRKTWGMMAVVALGLALSHANGSPWTEVDWFGVATLLSPVLFAVGVTLFKPRTKARHRAMLDALFAGRWEEALRRADGVGRGVPLDDISFRKAQALAGMDRLDEALRLVEPGGDGPAIPEWLYRSRLAQVYEFARRPDEALAQHERAVELAPTNSSMVIALARSVAWHHRDARRGRELIARARSHALSDLNAPFADQVEGLILLEEGRPREALAALEATHRVFHARRHLGLGYLPVEQALLWRALCHAALGESPEALRLYAQARPRLVVLRSPVLDRCDRAIGRPLDA